MPGETILDVLIVWVVDLFWLFKCAPENDLSHTRGSQKKRLDTTELVVKGLNDRKSLNYIIKHCLSKLSTERSTKTQAGIDVRGERRMKTRTINEDQG